MLIGATAGPRQRAAERIERQASDELLAEELERDGLDAFLSRWLGQPLFATLPEDSAGLDARRRNTVAGLAASLRMMGTGAQDPLWDRLAEIRVPDDARRRVARREVHRPRRADGDADARRPRRLAERLRSRLPPRGARRVRRRARRASSTNQQPEAERRAGGDLERRRLHQHRDEFAADRALAHGARSAATAEAERRRSPTATRRRRRRARRRCSRRRAARVLASPRRTASVRLPDCSSPMRSRRLFTTSSAVAHSPTATPAATLRAVCARAARTSSADRRDEPEEHEDEHLAQPGVPVGPRAAGVEPTGEDGGGADERELPARRRAQRETERRPRSANDDDRGALHRARRRQLLADETHRADAHVVGAADPVGVVVDVVRPDLHAERDHRARRAARHQMTSPPAACGRGGADGDGHDGRRQRARSSPCDPLVHKRFTVIVVPRLDCD